MRILKIYDKDFVPLTTLTEGVEFTKLSYKRALLEIGECEFTVKLESDKITTTNLEMYNRVEILDEGVVKFIGVIVRSNVNIDTATIRCREITYVLKKRILSAAYVANGTIAVEAADVFTSVNGADPTGITLGSIADAFGSVNTTFNRANAFEVLKQIIRITGNEFRLENDRTFKIAATIGVDLSDTVIFRYEKNLVAASNILQFSVEDDGDNISTKVYGKSDAFTSTQQNAGLITKYGVLEKYRDFRVANTNGILDSFTLAEVSDRLFSPDLELDPRVGDVFDVGDTVRVILKNSLIDIDASYKVLEKKVQYNGDQKRISVRINALPNDLAAILSERDLRLELLEKEV